MRVEKPIDGVTAIRDWEKVAIKLREWRRTARRSKPSRTRAGKAAVIRVH